MLITAVSLNASTARMNRITVKNLATVSVYLWRRVLSALLKARFRFITKGIRLRLRLSYNQNQGHVLEHDPDVFFNG